MNEFETLLSFLETTRVFYEKNRYVSNTLRNNNIKFVSCMSRILSARESKDDFELQKIRKFVNEDKTVANKDWMLQKIDEIKLGGS